jgi:hypothetical protein
MPRRFSAPRPLHPPQAGVACRYCRLVGTLCSGAPRPYAPRKRQRLIAGSLFFVLALPALGWALHGEPAHNFVGAIIDLGFALSGLGLLVGLRGCNACVARLFGERE